MAAEGILGPFAHIQEADCTLVEVGASGAGEVEQHSLTGMQAEGKVEDCYK